MERRSVRERRRLTIRTFLQSCFTPRRRDGRREHEYDGVVDWHEPELLFLALTILLLSVTDAFFTLTLMTSGATEANPFLAYILDNSPGSFAILKMVLTGCGVVVLVAIARARVFRFVRVKTILHWVLAGYVAVVAYEVWMMKTIF